MTKLRGLIVSLLIIKTLAVYKRIHRATTLEHAEKRLKNVPKEVPPGLETEKQFKHELL